MANDIIKAIFDQGDIQEVTICDNDTGCIVYRYNRAEIDKGFVYLRSIAKARYQGLISEQIKGNRLIFYVRMK